MKSEKIITSFGRVEISETPEKFPFGLRGERPVKFIVNDIADITKVHRTDPDTKQGIFSIPGVVVRGKSISCAFDASEIIAEYLGDPHCLDDTLARRNSYSVPLPGKDRYAEHIKDKLRRPHQSDGILYLIRRAYAYLADCPRAGKCIQTIGAAELVGSEKILIVCPSLAKYVWAEEVWKWARQESVILFGRSGADARVYCVNCNGKGTVSRDDGVVDEFGLPVQTTCPKCSGKGEIRYVVHKLEMEIKSYVTHENTGKFKKDGTPRLQRRVVKYTDLKPKFVCPVHTDEIDIYERQCKRCKKSLYDVLSRARWLICNFDILSGQKEKDDWGSTFVREDLPGWAPVLAQFTFDMAIADEIHRLRSYTTSSKGSKSTSRIQRLNEVCHNIERVYALSGTPVYGHVRDLYNSLDFISKGLWS